MNTDKEIFDSVFKKRGGRLELDDPDIHSILKRHVQYCYAIIDTMKPRYPKTPHIYIDFIDNLSFNACVAKFKDKYFIGINFGAYVLIKDLFYKILSSKYTFKNIGNSDIESAEDVKMNIFLGEGGITFDATAYTYAVPKDKVRMEYSHVLSSIVLDYIFLHELGHILRGHVDYVLETTGVTEWAEIFHSAEIKNKIAPSFSQTLEMDADSFSINNILLLVKVFKERVKNEPVSISETYKEIILNDQQYVDCMVFSLYTLFKIFGFANDLNDKYRSHPTPITRVILILTNIAQLIMKGDNFSEAAGSFLKIIGEAELCFSKVSYQKTDAVELEQNWKASAPVASEIINNWNNVRPFLLKHAYGVLPDEH